MPVFVAWLGTVAFAGITWGTIVMLVASTAVGMWQAANARRAAKDAFNASLKDRLVSVATTTAYRSRCYGRVRNVDGVLFKAAHGPDSSLYTFVVAVAGHEIDGFETAYFNDSALTLDGSGYVMTAPYRVDTLISFDQPITVAGGVGTATLTHVPASAVLGAVTDGTGADRIDYPITITSTVGAVVTFSCAFNGAGFLNYQYSVTSSKARVRFYTGAAGQDLSTPLVALGVPGIVAGVHRFEGIACMLVTLTYDVDAYPTGVPQFTATFRGAKCLDRRTSTTAWTENSAVIADDWAQYAYGGKLAADEIAADMVIASANACDVSHAFISQTLGGSPVTRTMPMFRCGIVCKTEADPSLTLSSIVESMAGQWGWAAGKLRMKGGFYTAPVVTVDESWLTERGSRDFNQGLPQNELVNIYTPTIADGDSDFLVVPVAPVRASAYITADGRELPVAVQLEGVTDVVHAQHVCGVMLRHSRQGFTLNLPCNFRGLQVELFDTVAVTLPRFGLVNKAMEVTTWSFSQNSGTNLLLRETSAGIFDPDAGFKLLDESPNTALPLPWDVAGVTGLAVVSGTTLLTDLSVVTRTLVTWNAHTQESVRQSGKIEVAYSEAGTDQWSTIEEAGDATQTLITGLMAGRLYLFKVRARNTIGVRSPWSTQVGNIIDAPAAAFADWTTLVGRPILFRALAYGGDDPARGAAGLYDETNTSISGASRSYVLNVIDRATGVVVSGNAYDVWNSPTNAAALASALNAIGTNRIVVVRTYDEPLQNRLTSGLEAAMYRHGASRSIFGSPRFMSRSAYVLIGIGGCGEGNGFESYCDATDPTHEVVDVAFLLKGGNLIVTGAASTPRGLADYGYTGTLDATTDLSLIARGSCVVAGNYGSKLGGVAAWDSDIYSRDSARFACYASAIVVETTASTMFGLNSDPATDSSYTSLDYAFFLQPGAVLGAYESGAPTGLAVSYAVGDVLNVVYDGSLVRYLQNGVVRRTVVATPGQAYFFDTSFYSPNSALRNMRFGPLSANDWASIGGVNVVTGQIAANAVAEVFQDNYDFAGATFGNVTARTFTVTPAVDCNVEFTATIGGRNMDGDSGSGMSWWVTAGAGAPVRLGGSSSSSIALQSFSASNAFAALAGVALVFSIITAKGAAPSVSLFQSTMRATLVKR